jgi:glycosyl transferase family 87
LVGLAAFLFAKGFVPALSEITSDFPGYFTSARIAVEGQDAQRLYDDSWFDEQTLRYGIIGADPSKFAPFPPPTALLLVPLAGFKPLTALRVVTAVNALCLICSIFLLARILAWNLVESALFVLSGGWAIISGVRFGQPYLVISTSCILGYYLYLQRRPCLAGVCFGLFTPIKYFPIVILAYFTFRREWKLVLAAAVTIAVIGLLSVAVLGWKVHQIFLLSIFEQHLIGRLSLHDQTVPFTAVYQSFDSLFDRLFVFDAIQNPQPMLAAPLLRTISLIVAKGAILLAAAAALVKLARTEDSKAVAPSVGILGILVLLVAPATATYTFVLLWLPIALLIDYFLAKGARMTAYLMLGTYASIGFIPYNYAYHFEGHGGLSVLAFPRLLLQLAMFICCVYSIAYPRPVGQRNTPVTV